MSLARFSFPSFRVAGWGDHASPPAARVGGDLFPALIGLLAFSVFFLPASRAQLIYDNLGSDAPFRTGGGHGIGDFTFLNQPGVTQQSMAVRFTAGLSLFLDSAALTLWPDRFFPQKPSPTFAVALLALRDDGSPGDILETAFAQLPGEADRIPLTVFQFSRTTLLSAGMSYWLAVSGVDLGPTSAWENQDNVPGQVALSYGSLGFDGAWEVLPYGNHEGGMRLFGVAGPNPAVPEPAVFAELGAFALLLFVSTRAVRSPSSFPACAARAFLRRFGRESSRH